MTPLHSAGEFLRVALLAVPLPLVRLLFVGSLLIVMVWVVRLPRSETTPPSGTRRWDENLKTGAIIALIAQVLIYAIL